MIPARFAAALALAGAMSAQAGAAGPVGTDGAGTAAEPQDVAKTILASARINAGLCVHVGCGDGALAAALAKEGKLLVHGLEFDGQAVAKARQAVQRLGMYGQASIDLAPAGRLPYADDMVNLLVVDDLPRAAAGVSPAEVLRVLRPGGVAVVGRGRAAAGAAALTEADLTRWTAAGGIRDYQIARPLGEALGGLWARLVKPRPPAMDDWTHRDYDAAGNCVSRDTAIGPLGSLRWIAGPDWPMGTGYQVSNGGILSAGGRVFGVTLNEVSNYARLPQERDHEWFLVARDAFNGMFLWRRPIGRRMQRDGQEFGDAVVATADRVYAVIGDDLVGLDGATGSTVRTYLRGVGGGGRLAVCGGLLVLWRPGGIRAMDAASGEVRWDRPAGAEDLRVSDGAVLLTTPGRKELVCLAFADGKERWRADLSALPARKRQLLLVAGGAAVVVWELDWQKGANGLAAFAVANGRRLWASEYVSCRAGWPESIWHVDGLLWRREGPTGLVGLDLTTGQEKRQVRMQGAYCGGCVRNIATTQYLVSTRPPNLLAWADGAVHPFRAGRHGCRAGVIVANGLLYSQPHGCKCVRESLRGFVAFAPTGPPAKGPGEPLERGPAASADPQSAFRNPPGFAQSSYAGASQPAIRNPQSEGWPTFRHDAQRTGGTAAQVPAELALRWQARLDDQAAPAGPLGDEWRAHPLGVDRLTAPTVAEGRVFAAARDSHRLFALDAATGRVLWDFTAGGRADTPPTVWDGLCLFGGYDGWAYCLRAADGALVWRLRAAGEDRRVLAHGQLESAQPVVGGVLVEAGVAYFVAGRTSAADGGVSGFALEPRTGRVIWSRPLEVALSDLLVMEDGALRAAGGSSAGLRFDPASGKPLRGSVSPGFTWDFGGRIRTLWGGPNRVLDRTWHILSVNDTAAGWMRFKQGYGPWQGQLLVASPGAERVYGFRFRPVHWSKTKEAELEFGGELAAWSGGKEAWAVPVPKPFQVEAMALAGDVLFAAGPADRFRRASGGMLWAFSAADGKMLREYPLDVAPAADGIALAAGCLYLTTQDGRILCYARPG